MGTPMYTSRIPTTLIILRYASWAILACLPCIFKPVEAFSTAPFVGYGIPLSIPPPTPRMNCQLPHS